MKNINFTTLAAAVLAVGCMGLAGCGGVASNEAEDQASELNAPLPASATPGSTLAQLPDASAP